MMKVLSVFLMLVSSLAFSQTSEESRIKTTVNGLFEGMKTSDSSKISGAFSSTAILQTITKKGDVKTGNIKDFALSIANADKGSLEEKITYSKILIDGNLASVWTPYAFYDQGKFSHCGVNSFQLVKVGQDWKIQYIIDTRRKDNCKK